MNLATERNSKNCSNQNVWCNSATPQAIFISNFSSHSRHEETITMIVLQCTRLHFLSSNHPPFSQHDWHVYTIGNLISFICLSIAFFIKGGKINVKYTENLTFLILKDDSILWTALSESSITSLKFEHLSNQRTKRRSDWCEIHTTLYALTYIAKRNFAKRRLKRLKKVKKYHKCIDEDFLLTSLRYSYRDEI